jgi:hypothetical protein
VYPEIKEQSSIIWLGSRWLLWYYLKRLCLHYGPDKTKKKFDEFRDNYFDIEQSSWLSMA